MLSPFRVKASVAVLVAAGMEAVLRKFGVLCTVAGVIPFTGDCLPALQQADEALRQDQGYRTLAILAIAILTFFLTGGALAAFGQFYEVVAAYAIARVVRGQPSAIGAAYLKFFVMPLEHLFGKPGTYRFQSLLPDLPRPSCRSTVDRFLASTQPLLTEGEHKVLKDQAMDFLKSGASGALQRQLSVLEKRSRAIVGGVHACCHPAELPAGVRAALGPAFRPKGPFHAAKALGLNADDVDFEGTRSADLEEDESRASAGADQSANALAGRMLGLTAGKGTETAWAAPGNWIDEMWLRLAYLSARTPLPVYSSFASTEQLLQQPYTTSPAVRAAGATLAALAFMDDIDAQRHPPVVVNGTVPFDMHGLSRQYGATRLPRRGCDKQVLRRLSVAEAEQALTQGRVLTRMEHIVVVWGTSLYRLVVQTPELGRITAPVLAAAFECIRAQPRGTGQAPREAGPDATAPVRGEWAFPDSPPVALLTAGDRDNWADAYKLLAEYPRDRLSLRLLEDALFVVSMPDEDGGSEPGPALRRVLHGSGLDLYFDKAINLVVYNDARLGINVEHTPTDGTFSSYIWESIWRHDQEQTKALGADSSKAVAGLAKAMAAVPLEPVEGEDASDADLRLWSPLRLRFDAPTSKLQPHLNAAASTFGRLVSRLSSQSFTMVKPSRDEIKKVIKSAPDAFVQAALQATAVGFFGRPVLTYESATTRSFFHGRTETIRSCSTKSTEFAVAYQRWLAEDKPEAGEADLLRLLREAGGVHRRLSREAGLGQGVDRHVLALRVLAAQAAGQGHGDVHPFLANPVHSLKFRLTTSTTPLVQLAAPPKDRRQVPCGGGFGPTAEDGVGCSYHFVPGAVYFHLTRLEPEGEDAAAAAARADAGKSAGEFATALSQTMRDLFEMAQRDSARRGADEGKKSK